MTDTELELYFKDLSGLLSDMKSSYKKLKSEQAKKLWIRIVERLLRYSYTETKDYSVNAEKVAKKLGFDGELINLQWHQQPKYDQKRKIIFHEHAYPLTELTRDFLEGKIDVQTCIGRKFCVWVTAQENQILNDKGYRNTRNGDWLKCYKDCGIELVINK